MSEKQLQHERESSRKGTNKIRKAINEAKEKGYFSGSEFGRHFLSNFVPEFASQLKEITSSTAWGRKRTTNIVIAYPLIQEALSLLDRDGYVLAVIGLKSILDSFGVAERNLPKKSVAAALVGRRIEDELRTNYYIEVAPDDDRTALINELNTKGSNPHFRRYGGKKTIEKRLKAKGWSDDLYPNWTNEESQRVGLFILEVGKMSGIIEDFVIQGKRKKQGYLKLSKVFEAHAAHYQAWLESVHVFTHPLLEIPIDWKFDFDAAYKNSSGGYYHQFIRRLNPMGRNGTKSIFMEPTVRLLNTLQKTSWGIDKDILKTASEALEKQLPIGSLRTIERSPVLDQEMPLRLKELKPSDPERIDWRKTRAYAYQQLSESIQKSIRSRQVISLAKEYQKEERFYLSWSCDSRGRMYSQQSFLHPQSSDLERAILRFEEGCELDKTGEEYAAQAVGAAFRGNKISYQERSRWTYENKELIQAITKDPLGMREHWQDCDEPWQFLQLAREFNRVCFLRETNEWKIGIGADSTASGLQLLSGMRRDPKGMKFTNLLPPDNPNDPPRDAYKEVLRIAREIVSKDPATAWLAQHLHERELGKKILMKAIYGASQSTYRYDIKDFFKSQGLFPDTINYTPHIPYLTTVLEEASRQVFPMAFETLDWFKKLWKEAQKNGSNALIWTTPNHDLIHIHKKKVDVIEVKTTHLGKISIGIGEGQRTDYNAIGKALAPAFVHSYDAVILKTAFHNWNHPIALVHDCLKVLPNDMDKAKFKIKNGFVQACKDDPLDRLANDMEVTKEQLPRLTQGTGNLAEIFDDSSYMFN